MLDMATSVRNYTSNEIAPLLKDKQSTSNTFIPQSVPAYSARTAFEYYHKLANVVDFNSATYKEAAINPTNPKNLADSFEADLQKQMEANANIKQVSDFTTLNGQSFFYIARPLRVSSPTCLTCHTTPETAPQSLVKSYGPNNGFGWKLNQVVAVQVIYVPAAKVFDTTMQSFYWLMGIFTAIFALVILLINFMLRRDVIQPVFALSRLAETVGEDKVTPADLMEPELVSVSKRGDELGKLSKVFTRMVQEVQARTFSLRQQVKNLQIEIDETRRKSQVDEIVDTDFFKDLQTRARDMRQQRNGGVANSEGTPPPESKNRKEGD